MGMYRDGRSRPTFDTKVVFKPVNRTAADNLGGYSSPVPDTPAAADITLLADVKDIPGRETVIGNASVATRTKSLVFAQAALKARLDADGAGFAKQWKAVIAGQEYDVTAIADSWVPGRYTRVIVEQRD